MITKKLLLFFLLVLPFVTSLSLQSQQIIGNVVDEDGNPVSGASLTIEAIAFETTADFDGNFQIPENVSLPITLTVSALGFATQVVQVYEDTIDNLSVVLQVGQNLDEVIITAGRKVEKIQDAPNSVSVIQTREIANKPVFNPLMYLEHLAGIDIQRQSGNRVNVNLRGPSGIFTSDTYVMLDYRGIVQTGLNVFDQGATTLNSLDLERVELVRGPVSSLYGPGIASGVVHFLSRDPFKHPGTEIELGGGNLKTFKTQVRHAGTNRQNTFGYKINAGYQQNGEWDLPGQLNLFGQPAEFAKPFSQSNTSLRTDLSLYFQVNDDLQLTTVAGFTNLVTNFWTDRGPAYQDADDFFIQARAKTDNLFVQFVYNSNVSNPNNKGFLYFTGEEAVIDRTQSEIQIQYNNELRPINTQYTLGAERRSGQFKAPVTFGRYDFDDDLIITGAYLQTKTAISPKFDVVLSGRLDHYGYSNEFSFSPNTAIVFKPNSKHTIRASFSQTYITPSAIELYTDFPYVQTPNLDIWLYGSKDKISVPENPEVQFFTPLLPNQRGLDINHATVASIFHQQFELPIGVPGFDGSVWNFVDATIRTFAGSLGLNSALVASLPLFSDHMKSDQLLSQLRGLEPITRGVGINRDRNPLQPRSNDKARLRKEVNFELGWKGIIANRVQLSVDVFNLTGSDFSQIRTITPLVRYRTVIDDIKKSISDGKLNSALEAHTLSYVTNVYNSIGLPLSGGPAGPNPIPSASQVAQLLWSGDGSVGGIKNIYLGAAQQLSAIIPEDGVLGVTISDNNPNHPKPVIIDSYTNSGIDKITYTGIDVGAKVLIDPNNSAYLNGSYISQNVWKGKADLGPQAQESDFFGLHKPRFRLRAGYNYNPVKGFNFGLATQFQSEFESLFAPLFDGIVESRVLANANVGYNSKRISVSVNVDNLFGTEYSLFPGMPIVGTRALVTARLKF